MLHPLDGAFFDLSRRAKIQVSGEDRHRYLNGQMTNDLAKASESNAIAACLLNGKGRIEAHVFVSRDGDTFVLDSAPELHKALQPRMERYVIADDVQVEDVTERLSILHVIGAALDLSTPARIISANRFGVSGYDVLAEAARHDEIFQQLEGNISFCGEDDAEMFRIEQGIPRWGRELTPEILPPEANLEESAIDYNKGCYVGQEVISRIKMSGQRNKKLCGFVSLEDMPLIAGMKLYAIGADEKEVGWITSATRSRRLGREIALGFLKRPFYPTKFKLDARDQENGLRSAAVRVEIVDLPFASPTVGH